MSTAELEDVLALVQRVLPDPAGFAERLVQQAVAMWADGSAAGATEFDASRARMNDGRTIIVDADIGHDSCAEVAAALGACECWGTQPTCPRCHGLGSSGWADPDIDQFQLFVAPAVERLATIFDQDEPTTTRRRESRKDNTEETT